VKRNLVMGMSDEEKWKADCDARTLREAEEIKADRGRMKNVSTVVGQQLDALTKVAKIAGTPKTKDNNSNSRGITYVGNDSVTQIKRR
jgi:hypothetical protein